VDLESVADELYALPVDEFVAARNVRSKDARAAGNRELATSIQSMRKPAVAAWAVNQLVREHVSEVDELLDLGRELRTAQTELAGADLRSLTRRRYQLESSLVAEARRLAAERGHRVSEEAAGAIRATLEATLIDPASAEAVRLARLAEPLQVSGFGFEFAGAVDGPRDTTSSATDDVADLDAHRDRRTAQLERARADLQRVETALEHAHALRKDADQQLRSTEDSRQAAADAVEKLRRKLDRAVAEHDALTARAEMRRQARDSAVQTIHELEAEAAEARDLVDRLDR
jgi:NCAIR mutase (PurE)-related protein